MSLVRNLVALLPIKEHSERVPGKNFLKVGTKPLYRHILNTLLSIDEIDLVVLNTDSDYPFAAKANDRRLVVRKRKKELCGDHVDMNLIIADDMAAIPSEFYLQTHATNPFLSADTIRLALGRFPDRFHDSLFSINLRRSRLYTRDARGLHPLNHRPDVLRRTQDLAPVYEENSCLYLFTPASFAKRNNRIGDAPYLFETPPLESVDIDTPDDLALARAIMPS